MHQAEHRYRQLVDSLPQIVYITNAEGQVEFVNERWFQLTGCPRDDLQGPQILDFIHPQDRPKAQEKWRQAFVNRAPFEAELRLRTAGGDYLWFLSRAVPVAGERGVLEWYGTSTDITEHKRTQSQLRRLFDANLIGIVSWNVRGGIREANDRFLQMLGYTREEFQETSLDWRSLTPPEWADADEKALLELNLQGSHSPYEKAYIRKDGSQLPLIIGSAYLEGSSEDGISFLLDVSPQKLVQEELEGKIRARTREVSEAYDFVESILDNIPHMIFVKEADELRFVRLNRAGERLLGMDKNDLLGRTDFDFFPTEQAQHFQSLDRQVLAGNEVVNIEEEPIQTPQGRRILHTKKIPLKDDVGKPRYLVGISEDITQKKELEAERLRLLEAEIARQESEKTAGHLKFLAEASSLLGSSLDFETTLSNLTRLCVPAIADWCSLQLLQNDGSLKQLAVAHQDPEKVKWAWQLHQKYPPREDSPNGPHAVVKTGKTSMVAQIDAEMVRQAAVDEEHLEILEGIGFRSYICAPIRVRGTVTGTLTLVTTDERTGHFSEADRSLAEDLCARAGIAVDNARLYQEAQLSNRLKDDFLATLSHELRTPINVIQGYSEILCAQMTQMEPGDILSSLQAIRRNAHLQTQIVSDLLDLSSIVTGKVHYEMKTFAPGELVSAILSSTRGAADAKRIHLSQQIEEAPALIRADPTRFHQVVSNLINNAIKFTPPGGTVICSVTRDADTCVLTVSDSGLGISAEFLPHVFDRFRQADSSISRTFGGLGLGLSIVKSITEAHGGSVSVSSAGPQQGATFQVRLPLGSEAGGSPETEAVQATVSLRGSSILVVEDSADNLQLFTRLLTGAGATVFSASSAAVARQILAREKPDMILSDIGMPDESGLEFMQWVRSEAGLRVPALAVTAHARQQEIDEARAAGFQEHLAKPVSPQTLLETVSRLLEGGQSTGT